VNLLFEPSNTEYGRFFFGTSTNMLYDFYVQTTNKISLSAIAVEIDGRIDIDGDIRTTDDGTHDLGETDKKWRIAYIDSTRTDSLYPNTSASQIGSVTNAYKSAHIEEIKCADIITTQNGIAIGSSAMAGSPDNNTLDAYEEGTYQPDLDASSSSTAITLNTSYEYLAYTKIGRQMTVTGELRISSVSSPSGTLDLALPETIGAIANLDEYAENFCVPVTYSGMSLVGDVAGVFIWGLAGGTTARISMQKTDGTWNNSIADAVQSGTALTFTFTYFTA
jgi:hypothetical protein